MLVGAHRYLASFFKKRLDSLRVTYTRDTRQLSTARHRDHAQQEDGHDCGGDGERAIPLPEAQIRDGEADAAEDERVAQPPEQPCAETCGPPALSPRMAPRLLQLARLAERGFGICRSARLDEQPTERLPP